MLQRWHPSNPVNNSVFSKRVGNTEKKICLCYLTPKTTTEKQQTTATHWTNACPVVMVLGDVLWCVIKQIKLAFREQHWAAALSPPWLTRIPSVHCQCVSFIPRIVVSSNKQLVSQDNLDQLSHSFTTFTFFYSTFRQNNTRTSALGDGQKHGKVICSRWEQHSLPWMEAG